MSTVAPHNDLAHASSSSKSRINVTAIIVIVLVFFLGLLFVCSGLFSAFIYPTLARARDTANRMNCSNNLKQIALAIHNYKSVYQQLPPAYTVDAAGNRLHSWRTLILPFVGEQALYNRIDLSKPWDDPANAILQRMDVVAYRCPSSKTAPGMTTYQIIDDPLSAFPGSNSLTFDAITDGLSSTILVFESDEAFAVHWAEPKDQSMTGYLSAARSSHRSGRNVVMADGSLQFIPNGTDPLILKGYATAQGGETLELDHK